MPSKGAHCVPQEAVGAAAGRSAVEADLAAADQRCAEWEQKCAALERQLEVCGAEAVGGEMVSFGGMKREGNPSSCATMLFAF